MKTKLKKPSKDTINAASYYLYVLDGATMNVAEMDRDQLMRALMRTIDMVEEANDAIEEASRKIGSWQEEG
jgi:hypothetical protein